jgi:hypothetical protein
VLQAAGLAGIAVIAAPGQGYAAIVAPMVIAATGIAMAMPAVQKAVAGSVSPPDIGRASGTYNTMRWFGAVFGVAILVAVFAATGSYASPRSFTRGFSWAIAVSAVIALIGAAAGLALPASRRAGRSLSLAALRRSGTTRPACGRQL